MAQPFVTGPVHHYVSFPEREVTEFLFNGILFPDAERGTTQPRYLGTAERSPEIYIRREWQPIFSDRGGSLVPHDLLYLRKHAIIRSDLTRWDERVYQALAKVPQVTTNFVVGDYDSGFDDENDVGTMMIAEGKTITLWMVFPYAANAKFKGFGTPAYRDMPEGYRFLSCTMEGDAMKPLGTTPRKMGLVWHAYEEILDSSTALSNKFRLYDHDMSAVPNPE